ncbi:MAG: hypothetical protein ABI398_08085 [Devosia sp.]
MKPVRANTNSTEHAATFGGLTLMVSAIAWWLSYYAQAGGMFARFDVKLGCMSGDSLECTRFQHLIGPSVLPAYSPLLLWLGVLVTILGLFLTRWNKA